MGQRSHLAQWLLSLSRARASNKAVVEALDGLPSRKIHCSVLAEEAIKAALVDYYEKNGLELPPEIKDFEPSEEE